MTGQVESIHAPQLLADQRCLDYPEPGQSLRVPRYPPSREHLQLVHRHRPRLCGAHHRHELTVDRPSQHRLWITRELSEQDVAIPQLQLGLAFLLGPPVVVAVKLRRVTDEAASRDQHRAARQVRVERPMSEVHDAQLVKLAGEDSPLGLPNVARLRLEAPLLAVALGDHVLPELARAVDQPHGRKPTRPQQSHQRLVKRPLRNGLKIGGDGVA